MAQLAPSTTGANFRFVTRLSGALCQARSADGPVPLVAFLPASTTAAGTEFTLADSWALPFGVYIFLGAPVWDSMLFAARAHDLLASRTWSNTRLLWIPNPNVPPNHWNAVGFSVTDDATTGAHLAALSVVPLRNYRCLLNGGLPVGLDPDQPAFTITPSVPGDVRLATGDGSHPLLATTQPLSIPLTGPAAGCLRFSGLIPIAAAGSDALDQLDIGCRFFFDDPQRPGVVASRRYRLFDTSALAQSANAARTLDLTVTLDPNAPLDPERTQLTFVTPAPLRSFYRTPIGSVIDLQPTTARLQFAARPTGTRPTDTDPLYLVPHGCFTIQPPATDTQSALLCGIGGSEYVKLDASSTLTFVAGQPAYAPGFDPAHSPDTTQSTGDGPRLTGPASTAWAHVTATTACGYFAQPDGAALYGQDTPPTGEPADTSSLLPFFEVQAATLAASTIPAANTAYPLVPYAGADADLTSYQRLEVQVLSQQRRQIIHDLNSPPIPPTSPAAPHLAQDTELTRGDVVLRAATPQGLLATFNADKTNWQTLQIAQSETQPPSTPKLVALQNVTDPLKAALLTNQQFIVVSDSHAIAPYIGPDNALVIANYQFPIDPSNWANNDTILLIKNTNKALSELIADTKTWVLGSTFNIDVNATQRRLTEIFITDPALTTTNPDLADFITLRDDSTWNGVLLLNVQVPMSGLPPELAGLAAGIDPGLFKAHHLGINQTPVPADLQPRDSSLFGLINYENDRPLATTGFDYSVRFLRVRFANSAIASFSSRIALALNEIFDTKVTRAHAQDNVLELDGVFQKHGDTGTYVFSETAPNTFATSNDAVLASVDITKVVFATQTQNTDTASTDTVQTVFSMWGAIAFKALGVASGSPVDLFSYDRLVFANLELQMSFPRATPTAGRQFSLDPSRISFDLAASTARPTAFATHFPVTAKGMLTSRGTGSPSDLGLLAVDTDLETTDLASAWFAFTYELNLGTVGALASKAGLTANMIIAWSPSEDKPAVFVGIKLPGSSGGKNTLTIEGVLTFNLFAVRLDFDGKTFLLKFNGITLSLFGQTLPPGATFDFFVFGDSDPSPGANALGWYGAYKKTQPVTPQAPAVNMAR